MYRVESEGYYNLRKILMTLGVDVPDERKREHRRMLASHVDALEKSAREEWRELGNGVCYRVFPWEGETEEELNRWERSMSSSPAWRARSITAPTWREPDETASISPQSSVAK